MAESFLLGRKAVAYFNAPDQKIGDVGAGSTPNERADLWLADAGTEVAGNLTDVTLNLGSDFADATTRLSAEEGFASQVTVLKNGEVTFEMRWLPDPGTSPPPYTFTQLIVDAWQTDDTVAMAFLDQLFATTGCQGFAANFSVSLEKAEALRDIQRMSVTLTVADSAVWYRKPSGP